MPDFAMNVAVSLRAAYRMESDRMTVLRTAARVAFGLVDYGVDEAAFMAIVRDEGVQ